MSTSPENTTKDSAAAPAESAGTARILSHMNKDHTLSLYDYLGYYAQIEIDPDHPKSSIKMISIDLDHLILEYTNTVMHLPTKATIPIVPPMASMGEARVALVRMAKEAAGARGFATHRIDTYIAPSSFLELSVIVGTFANVPVVRNWMFGYLPEVVKESSVIKAIEAYPWAIFVSVIAVHLVELVTVMRPLVNKWRVPSGVRFQWYSAAVVEGYPAIRRFKSIVHKIEGNH